MTGEEVLALAAAHGVRVALALGDLLLEADHEPPVDVVDALRDHKEAVVAVLSSTAEVAGEWRRLFGDHVATVMRMRGLPRPKAERVAFQVVLVEFLNRTYPATDPNRCACCGKLETPAAQLIPFGVGDRHAWLHRHCRDPWAEARRKAAIETLAGMGIVEPPKDEATR